VVNGAKYRAVRNQEERTVQVREAVRRHRARKKEKPSPPPPGEARAIAALERNDEAGFDQAVEDHLPENKDLKSSEFNSLSEQPSFPENE
jgi:hypothetical protein